MTSTENKPTNERVRTKGYRVAAAPTPTPLTAETEECVGDLRVLTFSYPDSDGEGEFEREYPRLPGVEVTVTGSDFSATKTTDQNGEALWAELPVGKYNVRVSTPTGYNEPEEGYVPGGDPAKLPAAVDVSAEHETVVQIGFAPQPATINGSVYFDESGCGDPAGQAPIGGVNVEVFCGGKRIDCQTSDGDGSFALTIARPGLISLVSKSMVRADGRVFRRDRNPILMQAEPGQTCQVALPYTASLGEIQAAACFVHEERDGETRHVPLPGVALTLYRGMSPTAPVLRQGNTPAVFSDLEEDDYTIVASGAYGHQGLPLEAVDPPDGVVHVHLCAGQTLKLAEAFCFRPCRGRIVGTVTDDACCTGLGGIGVTLTAADGEELSHAVTQPSGEYTFNVHPGDYNVRLEQQKQTLADGSHWVSAGATEQRITVKSSKAEFVSALRLSREVHGIDGTAFAPDNSPLPFLQIDIHDADGNVVAQTQTNDKGYYSVVLPRAGNYYVVPLIPGGVPAQRFPASVNSQKQVNVFVQGAFSQRPGHTTVPNGELREAVIDSTAYPILTEEIGYPPSPLATPSGGGGGISGLGQTATKAINDILGWKLKPTDPKGFLGALTASFKCKEVEGRTECVWTPRTYAVMTDLAGGISGAQASIYTRAQEAVDKALPLLDGLSALREDADRQDVDALKAILRSQMNELVSELGIAGGPRVTRVNQIFTLLLDPQQSTEPDDVGGQLGTLRDEMGLWTVRPPAGQNILINTVEEEQNATNFRILVDYMTSLRQSWINNQPFFVRPPIQPFFGTQLVILSRQLSVISESVDEVRFAMDSVFLGPAERQTLEIAFPAGVTLPSHPPLRPGPVPPGSALLIPLNDPNVNSGPMFAEELFSWVQRFAAEEGPRLIQEGGKFGVSNTFLPVAAQLRNLAFGAIHPTNVAALPRGYRTPRVRRALQELATQLDELVFLASPISHAIPSQV